MPEESDEFQGTGVELTLQHPKAYNRIVPASCFNARKTLPTPSAPSEDREAVLLFNERTKKTAQDTIEYFI